MHSWLRPHLRKKEKVKKNRQSKSLAVFLIFRNIFYKEKLKISLIFLYKI